MVNKDRDKQRNHTYISSKEDFTDFVNERKLLLSFGWQITALISAL